MKDKNNLILIVAGGTGGHLYPGLAVARVLVQRGQRVMFAVRRGDMGKDLLKREGFQVIGISGQGLPRAMSMKVLTFPLLLLQGFFQSWFILREFRPRAVMGMGGYIAFPVVAAAWLQGIRTLIHEQNVKPGVSNRLLSCIARSVAVSFPESAGRFPRKKVWVSGLPIRSEIGQMSAAEGRRKLNLSFQKITLLVFGGSQGAQRLNESIVGTWRLMLPWADRIQVLHITGEAHYEKIEETYHTLSMQSVVMPYCHEMAAAYAAADLVISRAGASTIVELIVAQRPAILVPFPLASENHQYDNADVLVKKQVAEVIADADFKPEAIAERLSVYVKDPARLEAMKKRYAGWTLEAPPQQAANRLADFLTE